MVKRPKLDHHLNFHFVKFFRDIIEGFIKSLFYNSIIIGSWPLSLQTFSYLNFWTSKLSFVDNFCHISFLDWVHKLNYIQSSCGKVHVCHWIVDVCAYESIYIGDGLYKIDGSSWIRFYTQWACIPIVSSLNLTLRMSLIVLT